MKNDIFRNSNIFRISINSELNILPETISKLITHKDYVYHASALRRNHKFLYSKTVFT